MTPLDLIFTVAVLATFQIVLSVFVGWFLVRRRDMRRRGATGSRINTQLSSAIATNELLTSQLERLSQLQNQLNDASETELASSIKLLQSILEQVILAIRQNQDCLLAMTSQARAKPPSAPVESQHDTAGLTVEQWFPAAQSANVKDRRKSPRFTYHHSQLIAPMVGRRFPNPEDYFEVPFNDLSTDGFSFYIPEEMNCEKLVAKLGTFPNIVPVLARVARQQRVQRGDEWVWLVACEILRRMNDQTSRRIDRADTCDLPMQLEVAV